MENDLGPLFTVLGITACALVIYAFGRLLLEVVWRVFMAVALAIFTSLFLASSFFDGGEEGTTMGVVCGIILLPFILKAIWSLRGPVVHRPSVGARSDDSHKVAHCQPDDIERDREPEPANDLDDAWTKAVTLTGEAALRDAQAACAKLLASADSSPTIDAGLIDAASFVRRQVPALVQETDTFCTVADEGAYTRARLDLVSRLFEIGKMAREVVQERNSRARESLSLRHAHIASRLGSFE